jgi:uncharacterized MAPEG superfamily protein
VTTALWCVLIAGLLPYAATLTAKVGGAKFDNANPRDWLASQAGFRRRANSAQLNGFEAFPLFAVAVLVAQMLGVPQGRVDMLAVAFVAARVAYLGFWLLSRGSGYAALALVVRRAGLCGGDLRKRRLISPQSRVAARPRRSLSMA